MKFQNTAMPPEHKNKLMRIKWHWWRGHADRALIRLLELKELVEAKYKANITTLQTYVENNKTRIVDYRTLYKVMKGFKKIFCALIFCTAFEEFRQFFSVKNRTRGECRSQFMPKFYEMQNMLSTAT